MDLFSDVDECASNTDTCEQGCNNIYGGYVCTCPSGFTLSSNQRNCIGKITIYLICFLYSSKPIYKGIEVNKYITAKTVMHPLTQVLTNSD